MDRVELRRQQKLIDEDIVFSIDYFKWRSKLYSTTTCKTTMKFIPDFQRAKSLSTKYFYDPSIFEYLRCFGENVAFNNNYERLIRLYEKSKTIAKGASGQTLLYNDFTIIKVPLDEDDQHPYAEYMFGTELNKLNSPNLMKTYGAVLAPYASHPKSIAVKNNKEKSPYLLLEYVRAYNDFRGMVRDWCKDNDFHSIIVCFLQIFYTLWIANDKLGFVHCDLHDDNILVIPMNEPVAIPYFLPNGETVVLITPYVVKIIDFGYVRMNVPVPAPLQNKYGKVRTMCGEDNGDQEIKYWGRSAKSRDLSTPFFDLFKLAGFTLENVIKKCKHPYYFSLLTVFFEYIPFMDRYIDFKTRKPKKGKLDRDAAKILENGIDRFYDMNIEMARTAEKTKSMEGYHQFLQYVLFDYFDVKYVFINTTNIPKNIYWLECDNQNVQKLVKKGYQGIHSCRTLDEAKSELNYNLYNISTLADYIEVEKPPKTSNLQSLARDAISRAREKIERYKNTPDKVYREKINLMRDDIQFVLKYLK